MLKTVSIRLNGESGKCLPISLTTLGHPTVLAYGSTALLTLSGVWLKLANAQTLTTRYPDKPPLLVSTNGEKLQTFPSIAAKNSLYFMD